MKIYSLFYVVDDIPDDGWGTEGRADYCGTFTSKEKIEAFLRAEYGKSNFQFPTGKSKSTFEELLGKETEDDHYFMIVEGELDKGVDENIVGWWYTE